MSWGRNTNIFMNSNLKQNKLREALRAIKSNVTQFFSRVKLAKLATQQILGHVPEGSASYRRVCPRGAGSMNQKQIVNRPQILVGARKAHRRSVRFIQQHKFTAWGRKLNAA